LSNSAKESKLLWVQRSGSGSPLLLLHGWAMHAGIFASSIATLSAHYCVHAIDLPGHGHNREQPFALEAVRESLHGYLDALDQPAHIVGWSLGGALAAQLALDAPARTRSLLCIAASARFVAAPDWPHAMPEDVIEKFARDLAADWQAVVDRFLVLEVLGSTHEQSELRFLRAAVNKFGAPHPSALTAGLAALHNLDLRARLPALSAIPNLWLAGRRDRICAPAAVAASAQLANGRFEMIHSAHAPFLSDANLIQRMLATLS
jgi:pimeloyl-[acyl-carrier protein] methyl ester esterase